MTKEIDLNNSYRVELTHKKGKLIQYIEANNVDEAIKKAKTTFKGNLENIFNKLNSGSMTQKACQLTKLEGKLRFGFTGGWFTLNVTGLTIFEALDKVKNHNFTKSETIFEIYSI